MKTRTMRMNPAVHMLALAAVLALGAPVVASAAVVSFTATLSGAAEAPPNASMGTGFAQVDIDPVAKTMNVFITFEGLSGVTTACHIHGPTTVAGTGTAALPRRRRRPCSRPSPTARPTSMSTATCSPAARSAAS